RPRQQFTVAGGDEIGADTGADIAAAIVIELGDADPFHRRMTRRDLAAKQADPAGADDGETDTFGGFFHVGTRSLLRGAKRRSNPERRGCTGLLRSARNDEGNAKSLLQIIRSIPRGFSASARQSPRSSHWSVADRWARCGQRIDPRRCR